MLLGVRACTRATSPAPAELRTRGMKGTSGAIQLRLFIATVTPPRTQREGITQSHTEIQLDFESCPSVKLALEFGG